MMKVIGTLNPESKLEYYYAFHNSSIKKNIYKWVQNVHKIYVAKKLSPPTRFY